MPKASDNPDQAETLRLVLRHHDANLWTAIPGRVSKYDATTQRATIKPAVIGFRPLADGEEEEELPEIPNVPIVHPSGGKFFCSFPMQVGDPVVLVFCSRDIGPWKAGSGDTTKAEDNRTHDLSDAVAFPGAKPKGDALQGADADNLVIGSDEGGTLTMKPDGTVAADPGDAFVELAGATAALARADLVDARLDIIETWAAAIITVFNDHDHLDGEGQPCSKAGQNASGNADTPMTALPSLSSVACDKVKGT